MIRALILCACIALVGCGQRYVATRDCRGEVGREPYAIGHAFGLIGGMMVEAQPEHQEWQARLNNCVEGRLAHE